MENDIVILGAVRTAIGSFGGSLSGTNAVNLGAIVIKEAIKRAGISPTSVDHVIMGCVIQAAQGQNVSRQAALRAGLREETTAETLNIVCGSGLESVNKAALMVMTGQADIVVAGGMENMSMSPYSLEKSRFGYRMNDGILVDNMLRDALWDSLNDYHMGITAENVAEEYGISRSMQDEFAAESQQKCENARNVGKFNEEIVPVEIKFKKEILNFDTDEYPRNSVTAESISKLRSAFKENGTVTAANSSGINDGAAAVIVMKKEKALEMGLSPHIKWVGSAISGVKPSHMGIGPAFSTNKLLKKLSLSIEDLDLIEANEAFAAQALAVGKILNWNNKKVNVNGGAIALGHPVGASGCRILVTLIHEMKRQNLKRGLATLCVGGGMGVSTIIESI